MRRALLAILGIAIVAMCYGCQTTERGVHAVPTSRDYGQLERTDIEQAVQALAQAHRVGAAYFAPYEYFSAEQYLNIARKERAEGDRAGMWDYAGLAKQMAEAAVRKGSGIPDKGPAAVPADEKAVRADYDRVKAQYSALDAKKAVEVSPAIYARATAALSLAEHDLLKGEWKASAEAVADVQADVETLLSQDTDKDGIPDMKDGAPWAPEDKDGFQDEDGIPDPDNDQDAILDADDKEPMKPETINRWHDDDGVMDAYPKLETVYFAIGSTTVAPDSKGFLRGLCIILAEWPGLKLHLAGYANDAHSDQQNLELSKRRAVEVQQYLVEHGLPASRSVVTFHGAVPPAEGNPTNDAMNRRVEMSFE